MNKLPANIGLIGVGLIGGSLAVALRAHGYTGALYAYDCDPAASAKRDAISDFLASPQHVLERCELVVIATPVGACQSVLQAMQSAWSMDKTVSDVGSTKQAVIAAAHAVFGKMPDNIVPAHPIAGNEKSGAAAAHPQLFSQQCVLLTPLSHTNPEAVARVRLLWESVGAYTECIAADQHDYLLARSSHLPHVVAYALIHSLFVEAGDDAHRLRYVAGGLRDFTRIAASDPIMWRDICLSNRDQLLQALDCCQGSLNLLRTAIEQRDGKTLESMFSAARQQRLSLSLPRS